MFGNWPCQAVMHLQLDPANNRWPCVAPATATSQCSERAPSVARCGDVLAYSSRDTFRGVGDGRCRSWQKPPFLSYSF